MPRNKRRRSRRRAPREVQSRSDDSCENPSDGMQPSEEEASVSAAESENSQHEEGAEGTTDSDDKEIISDMLIHGSENMCATSLTQGQSDVNHQSLLDDKASPKYRVESPGVSHPGLIIKKSHSFGDTTVQIQELSSGGSSLVNSFDNPGNVSEPESSELEEDPLQDPSTPTNEDKLEFDITAEGASSKDLSSEQDEKIRELISSFMESAPSREKSPPEVIAQRKLDKTRKRAAIESHFAPQFMNPRFLDSIREESSDTDGGSDRLSVDRNPKEIDRDEDMFDEEDDDVFIDNAKVSKKANAVFPKGVTLNLSERRKHVSALRKPVSGIIREEPQCVLLDTKILEPESIPGSSSTWETTKTDEVQGAEVVYLESGSSSASELDYSADGDGEDSVTEDVDVRIETPVIESDVSAFVPPDEQSELLLPTSCKSESESIADSHSEPHLEILSEPASEIVSQALSKSEDEQFDPVSEPRLESENEQLNPISEPLSMGASEQLDPMSEPLSISASEVLDPMSEPLSEIVSDHPPSPDPLPNPDECDIPDFHRQDSSGSISSQTHSTSSHSQCTARYMASSMTDLEMDFEPSAIAGAPESPCDQNTDMASSTTPQSLRQQCLDRLSTMPYGNIVLRELADVSQNISDLLVKAHGVSKPATPSPPPVPALPARELLIDVSDPFQDGNFYSSDPQIARHATPPPVPARPTAVHPNSAHDSLHRDGSRDGIACAKDDNRLLAIIRESENEHQQSAPAAAESSATDQVRDVTMVKDPREFDNMFEALSKRFSNYELGHGAANHAATTKRFSNIETSSYESCRRVENGRVVVDEMKRHSEKITDDNGDVSKSVESESSAMPKDKVGANCGMDENSKGGFLNRDSGTTKICGDDFLRVTRREKVDDNFDFVPRRRAGDRRAWVSRNNLTVVDESPENVTRPLAREDNLCRGQRSATEIKAPRLSELDASGTEQHFDLLQNKVSQRRSMIDTTPITPHVGTGRRLSLPRDFHEKQLQYIRQKEAELQAEFEKLELDRKRLEEEITTMRMSTVRDESQSKRSSLLSEEEIFRQQMHSEWLDKVAEREERRLQKVMKVTKSTDDIPVATKSGPADIENEFLRKVKERRTKLSMPADSDWESGAESQPQPRESQREPTVHNVEVKVVDGEKEATINKLPKHLQEFAESFTTTTHDSSTGSPPPKPRRFQPRWKDTKQEVQLRPRKPNQELSASQLTLNRKSLSESDLLHEIDKSLVLAKGFLFAREERTTKVTQADTRAQPNEIIHPIRLENSNSESDYGRSTMTEVASRQTDGVGGQTLKEGMPVVLRSEIRDDNQTKWYKKVYNTIHKAKDDDDYVTVRYKTRRGRYPYRSNGYMSEPEPNYDSDYSYRYTTLDRRRTPSAGSQYDDSRAYGTMPNPIRSGHISYRNQPGRIEDYTPGRSSVSEREKREWWDEVMDIFDGHLEQQRMATNYSQGYLSRALKEQGYESDSSLVFRKRDDATLTPLSPVEQKLAYRSVQAGGEPPLQGFRKPAPEKPKDEAEPEIEYIPITSTLTKIRVHRKVPQPQAREVLCYPITSITRPIDMFGAFPKEVKSFVPTVPPAPPSRKSSRINSTLKLFSETKVTSPRSHHASCFSSTTTTSKAGRSKSASATYSASTLKEEKNLTNSTRIQANKQIKSYSASISPRSYSAETRRSSPSPVAFGRSISKERTFAEEKKRLEEALPQCRRLKSVTTRILKKSDVTSPDAVKKAIHSTFRISTAKDKPGTTIQSSRKTKLGNAGNVVKSSSHLTSSRTTTAKEKSGRTSLAISSTSRTLHKTPTNTRSRSVGKSANPTVTKTLKTSSLKATKTNGKSTSNLSLARTSSTYSIDSTNSKRRAPCRPTTITRFPISEKKPKKKELKKKDEEIQHGHVEKEIVKFEEAFKDEIEKKHREFQDSINRSIRQHSDAIKTDCFFQNLFLRDFAHTSLPVTTVQSSVLDKVRLWNSLTTKSEPTLRRSNSYLIQKRPVTSSKFKIQEREHFRQSRSLSPVRVFRPGRLAYEHISKFDSFYQLSDEEEEFGSLTEFNYSYQERSRSEPPGSTILTEIVRPNSPVVIHGHRSAAECRESSRSSTRSPSCRRIQSFRSTTQQTTSEKCPKTVARARSLNSADRNQARRDFLNDQLSHSSCSLNILEKHTPVCNHRKSERFQELNKFYSNLERVGQLERATSSSDLRPIRRQEEIIDFDLWKKIRAHEKAEKELNFLVGKLKQEQRDKDLLFRPKDVEDLRWKEHLEPGLRIKEKSVEDLKELFQQKASEAFPDEEKRQEIESTKDTYKPFWRGNSVLDLATNMVVKYNPGEVRRIPRRQEMRDEKCFGLSRKLVSTLSRDQVAKLKNQLNEIYSSGPGEGKKESKYEEISEKYIVTVPSSPAAEKKSTPLTVRSQSLVSREELLTPVLKRHQARIALDKAESISSISEDKVSKVIHKFENVVTKTGERNQLTEVEKKRLSASFCHEIKDLVAQRRQRMASPSVVAGKETRGAIAAESAKETLPGRPYYSLELTETVQSTSDGGTLKSSKVQTKTLRSGDKKTTQKIVVKEASQRPASKCETESGSSEASNRTVIYRTGDDIKNKIQYFEEKEKDDAPGSIIYHAREDSSPDEEEVMKIVEQKVKQRRAEAEKKLQQEMKASQSFTDLREIFGEKTSVVSSYNCKKSRSVSPAKSPTKRHTSPEKSLSNTVSIESVSLRSRSISPEYDSLQRSYLNMVHTGDVQKMRSKFESLSISPSPVGMVPKKPRRFRSDPDLSKSFLGERGASPVKTTVRDHEMGDVSWITHKFETKNAAAVAERSRSRTRRTSSPIQKVAFRRDDRRFMPHIDIISKTASLKKEIKRTSSVNGTTDAPIRPGEVEKIRHKFEEHQNMSLLGQMYTSAPDITELKDISSYLSGSWVAHRYPKPQDNARSPNAKNMSSTDGISVKKRDSRPSSTSPPRTKSLAAKILRPFYDAFADQKFDPLIHRPKSRYIPDMKREAEVLWEKIHGNIRKPSVKFQGGHTFYLKNSNTKYTQKKTTNFPFRHKLSTQNSTSFFS
ncbi:uncharacterized protein LOC129792352 isoform X5 [Lutzomyia longipalpis]|uniref:uncharacterized protein LOC129792352 isoform X5 n=1 Tax=Lutzomyia longipalpis TaxID=7200 RepID=UPI002483DDC5|nr:uncharacterized protein LOC129792352 isoform X5 [Lutzomyia longipalpis]